MGATGLIPGMQYTLMLMQAELTRMRAKCLFDAAQPKVIIPKPVIIPEIQFASDDFLCKAIDQSSFDWITDSDFQNFRVSQDIVDYTGYQVSKFQGASWLELVVHPEDRRRVLANYQQCCEVPEKPFCITYRLRGKDGHYRWVVDHGVPRYRRRGNFAGHIGKVELFSTVMRGAA
jgi:PAS domain S-box-containing protein